MQYLDMHEAMGALSINLDPSTSFCRFVMISVVRLKSRLSSEYSKVDSWLQGKEPFDKATRQYVVARCTEVRSKS